MILTDLENIVVLICFYSLLFSTMFFFLKTAIVKILLPYTYGNTLLLISNINMIILLINRWLISKHFPLSNLYESTVFLAWSLTTIYFVLLYKTEKNDWLGVIIAPSAMLIYGFAILGLPEEMQKFTLLIPALQSYWLMMHVSMMILSYASLLFGCLLSMTLLIVKYEKILNTNLAFFHLYKYSLQLISFERIEYTSFSSLNEKNLQLLFFKKKLIDLINQLDYWSFKIISIGFPFLTIGIMSGAVWANEAWGSYWSWDPKETWAFITWLIFAIYLHSRITKIWSKETSAIIAAFGFLVVWICYLGVNLLGKGLHSYGWFS
jgi:cytochrome c-type biogenesis protein CcsB